MRYVIASLACLAATRLVLAAEPAPDYFFQPKDRIVFLGDSITEQYQYSTYMELYLTTRFPKADYFFLNAGIGGDTAQGGANRFRSQVLAEKPNKVTINFGMNDGGYGKFNPQANKVFIERTRDMLRMAKEAGVKVALVSPNAVDPRNKSNGAEYVETQKLFYAPLAGAAKEFGVPFVDQYAITRAAQDLMAKDDPKAEKAKPYPDGFHTAGPGGMLMAHAILTGLGSPAVVSEATIDAAQAKSTGKDCEITDLKANETAVSFQRLDAAMPWPIQKDWLPMLPYTNQLKDLNWYGLKVAGLKEGNYAVKIDGEEVARFTASQLAEGVNLGNVTSGNVWKHGTALLQAIDAKNRVVHGRFRGVHLAQIPDWLADVASERKPVELEKRMKQITEAQAKVNELAKPKAHTFSVVAVN